MFEGVPVVSADPEVGRWGDGNGPGSGLVELAVLSFQAFPLSHNQQPLYPDTFNVGLDLFLPTRYEVSQVARG